MKYDAYRKRGVTLPNVFASLILVVLIIILKTTQVSLSQSETPASAGTSTPSFSRSPTLMATRSLSSSPLPQRSLFALPSVPGQTQVDANTVALYHFDSPSGANAIDATGNFTGTLYGNASITPRALYEGALALDGNSSYVRIGNVNSSNFFTGQQGTIEAFVDFSLACQSPNSSFPIIVAGGEFGSNNTVLLLGEDGDGLGFGIYENGNFHWANSGINGCRYLPSPIAAGIPYWPYETWRFHHVAGTWGPRGMEIWVDGVLHGVANTDPNAGLEPYPYMCNPQTQVGVQGKPPNPSYPLCQTPAPVNLASPVYPPGDYLGGLPTYSTFSIGCGYQPSMSSTTCFKGRIDEVRISNIQRTFSPTVVPTVTPMPTQTPVPISGEYAPDGQTLTLFHLNFQNQHSVLDEKTQSYRGIGWQASVVPGGRFGSGLAVTGNDSAIGTGNLGVLGEGTLEAWVDFSDATVDHPIFSAIEYYNSSGTVLNLVALAQGHVRLTITGNTGGGFVESDLTLASLVNCWHHVAGTFGPRGLEIWIDGTLRGTNNQYTGGMISQVANWQAACDFLGKCVKGMLDEVRVSNNQRTFTSQAPAFRPIVRSPSTLGTSTFLPLVQVAPPPSCAFGP